MATRINLQIANFSSIEKYYKTYCSNVEVFRKRVSRVIEGANGTLYDNPVNTCALRLSYAFHRAGIKLPRFKRTYRYVGKYKSPAYFPSRSTDFKWLLNGEIGIKPKQRRALKNKKGIILFSAGDNYEEYGARGHVTLFRNAYCLDHGDDYWKSSCITKIWVWLM